MRIKEKRMKLTKRILVAVLSLALLASVFVFSATAENTFNAEGITDIEDILEYYTLDDYLADNYDNGEWNTEYTVTDSDWPASKKYPPIQVTTENDPTATEEDGVLSVSLPFNKKSGYMMGSDTGSKEILTDTLLLTFDIYFEDTCDKNLLYELKVGTVPEKEGGRPSAGKSTILGITFVEKSNGPRFFYSDWDANTQAFKGTSSQKTFEDMIPETGKWYSISIAVNAKEDVFSFSITDTAENITATSGELDMSGCAGVWGFYCYGQFASNSGRTEAEKKTTAVKYYIDDMEIYEGTYVRYPSYKEEITATHLADLDRLYNAESSDNATKLRIAEVLAFLYGLDEESFPSSLREILPDAEKYINETYAAVFCEAVAAIDKASTYYERMAHLDVIEGYDVNLPANSELSGRPGITSELYDAVVACRELVEEEKEELAVVKEQSENFIILMQEYDAWMAEDGDDTTNRDFQPLNDFYDVAASNDYAMRDVAYEGVAAANESFADLEFRVTRINADVEAFIDNVTEMELAESFGPLYAAYVKALAGYTKYGVEGIINPDLNMDSHEVLSAKIEFFVGNRPSIEAKKLECDTFNHIMEEASNASYYTSLVAKLGEAAEYYPLVEIDYPGVAEAVELYNALLAQVADTESASEAYINSVAEIANKTDFYQKKAAIDAALILKEFGDVLGVEGVKEANLALSAAQVDINLKEGNSTTLIALVEQIKAAKTLSEKRELIRLAVVSAEGSENTYKGVTEAKAALEAAIDAFESDVAAANGILASATEKAQAVASAVGAFIFIEQAD